MIPWELRGSGQGIEIWPGRELDSDRVGTSPIKPRQGGRRGLVAANTRNDSVELTTCQVIIWISFEWSCKALKRPGLDALAGYNSRRYVRDPNCKFEG